MGNQGCVARHHEGRAADLFQGVRLRQRGGQYCDGRVPYHAGGFRVKTDYRRRYHEAGGEREIIAARQGFRVGRYPERFDCVREYQG